MAVNRVAFFETSLSQLKKDLPKYIQYQAGTTVFSHKPVWTWTTMNAVVFHCVIDSKGVHTALPKGLRTVASSEPHSALQFFLFLYAKKQEELAKYQDHYAELAKESREMLESWDKQLISPMKVCRRTRHCPCCLVVTLLSSLPRLYVDPYPRS